MLRLHRETVRDLDGGDLDHAAGGVGTLLHCQTFYRCDSRPACEITFSSCLQATVSC